jgi:hypothetical protein
MLKNPYVLSAQMAADYATQKLTYGAVNVDGRTRMACARMAEARDFLLNGLPGGYNTAYVFRIAESAIRAGAGNCGEYCAVAFRYLYTRNILPLDFVSYTRGDHAFLVLGRPAYRVDKPDKPTDIKWFEYWGPDPVICDPWVGLQGEPIVTTMADYKERYDADHVETKLRVELSLTKIGNRVYGSSEAPT